MSYFHGCSHIICPDNVRVVFNCLNKWPFEDDKSIKFINPDNIARKIAPNHVNDTKVSFQAGREAIKQTV
ncbi:MAG: hypothetical protein ACWIPH_04055 [Ostreibacterium sp.]